MMKRLRELVGSLTIPSDAVFIEGGWWLECYPTLTEPFFKLNGVSYKYKWRLYEQNWLGVYRKTAFYLQTNKDYKGEEL